jgi:L-ribulose-5-phosphate 3-epimerase
MSNEKVSRRAALKALLATPVLAPFATPSLTSAQAPQPRPPDASATLQVGIVSRHLQWTTVEDAIDLARTAGYDAIEWNVRAGGHIEPERVEQDLPRVVELTRKAGLAAAMITTAIQDAASPHAEAILRTANGLGIRFYRGGQYFRYDYKAPLLPQIEALKPRIASLVALNQKFGMTWAYHTHSGGGNIGGNVWDIWMAIRDFDPSLIALNYDTAHTTIRGGNGWGDAARVALPFIKCLAIKDARWEQVAGRGWVSEFVPIGEGLVDFKMRFELLKSAGFRGPVNVHFEHHGLLGTNVGTWKLAMPRSEFLAIITQDLDRLRAAMRAAAVV